MATQPKKKTETMSLRIPAHRIEDLRLIAKIEEREIPWMLRRAIDMWCDKYFDEHPGARTQQAPARAPAPAPTASAPTPVAPAAAASSPFPGDRPVMAALTKTAWFKGLVAELEAELPAELVTEPAVEPKAEPKAKLRYRFVHKGQASPKGEAHPAVAVPPTSFPKHREH
jgi:hypothetical protein